MLLELREPSKSLLDLCPVFLFGSKPKQTIAISRGVQTLLVSLCSFSDFSLMSSCSSRVYLKLKARGSSEAPSACADAVGFGFVQFIEGIFSAALQGIHPGNVGLLVLVLCIQALLGGLCEGCGYNTHRENYYKTREWTKRKKRKEKNKKKSSRIS